MFHEILYISIFPHMTKVIIWTILVVLGYPMLHTKFQGHRSIGSGVEDFLRFLPDRQTDNNFIHSQYMLTWHNEELL